MNANLQPSAPPPGFRPFSIPAFQPRPQFDPYWNFQSVIFQVERTLFSVWKSGFLVKGTPFETMFSLPTGNAKPEGSSPENPIVLEGVTAEDFRVFLRILYPLGVAPVTQPFEWLAVLRLAHKWEFVEIRQKAVTALATHIAAQPAKEKVRMGYQFLVQDWLKQGLIDTVLDKNLQIEHLRQDPYGFDQESIIKMLFIQSKAWQKEIDRINGRYPYVAVDVKKFVNEEVEKTFATELNRALYTYNESV